MNQFYGRYSLFNKGFQVPHCRFDPEGELLLICSPVPLLPGMFKPVFLSQYVIDLLELILNVIPCHPGLDGMCMQGLNYYP